jgi:hypothetical protein
MFSSIDSLAEGENYYADGCLPGFILSDVTVPAVVSSNLPYATKRILLSAISEPCNHPNL